MSRCEPTDVAHGADALVFDTIGRGWKILCTCGWGSGAHKLARDAGARFDTHLQKAANK